MTHPLRRIALLLLAATIPTLAQRPPTPTASTLKVTTRLTRIDVTATDANGNPVRGLTQADFNVLEDGKRQPIKHFTDSSTDIPSPAASLPPLPPNVYTNVLSQPVSTGPINVLLIDNITTGGKLLLDPQNLAAEKREAVKYLQSMPPGKQFIVMELTDRLRILQGLTSDRDVLLASIRSIPYEQNPRASLRCSEGTSCAVKEIEICTAMNTQSGAVVDGLENLSTYLSSIQGRKNILWFFRGMRWLTDPAFAPYCVLDMNPQLQHDFNLLTDAQAALYPIDTRGVEAPVSGHAQPIYDHVSMEDFADATGGVAYYNTNDLASAIGQAIAVGNSYYSLFYVPPATRSEGTYHKITVHIDRPAIHLVYRKGYTFTDPNKLPASKKSASSKDHLPPDTMLTLAMAHDTVPSTQILFTVAVTPSTPTHPGDPVLGQLNPNLKGKPLTRYDFNYRVLPGDITLTDRPDGRRQASVEFTAAAYDGTGEMLNILRQTVSFDVTPAKLAAFLAHPLPVLLQLDLPPGPIFLRAAIRDLPSSKLGTLEIPITVPK
ncbi:MAG TPA: VWA domain-containing protein [Acidobacteriaceae bacterium]|nr:VWA domain-containing protein [Acidobacteriaceae bacterium]